MFSGYYWLDYRGGSISSNCLKLEDDSDEYVGQIYTKNCELFPTPITVIPPITAGVTYDVNYPFINDFKVSQRNLRNT